MSEIDRQIHMKAKSFVDTLSRLKPKEREQTPNGHYGQDYNNLRELAMKTKTDIAAQLWPPAIAIKADTRGGSYCEARYAEIETYARQILNYFPMTPATGLATPM